jgi:ribosomal protein L7Ae-like RNA K-turn-binding protein
MNKILSFITLSKKAGKIAAGFEEVRHNVFKEEVHLVVLTEDLSEKTSKNVRFICDNYNVRYITIKETMETMGKMIGKKSGIIGIKDEGLSNAIIKAFENDLEVADGN